MILTICLNAAIDVTYGVASLVPGASHAVGSVRTRSGGKAVNTARVLGALGEPVTLCGFAGGHRGDLLRAGLEGTGVIDRLTEISGETRQSIAVVSEDVTVFNEPGPSIAEAEWRAVLDAVSAQLADASAVVISGSVPPGTPLDGYSQLVRLAHEQGVSVVVDAAGPQLVGALAAEPEIVAPNRSEAASALGSAHGRACGRFEEAARLVALSGRAAVVSDGPRGIAAIAEGRRWLAAPPEIVPGNPTGAGDALNAGLAIGLARNAGLEASLADALALATAAVLSPVAGDIDLATYRDLAGRCSVEEI